MDSRCAEAVGCNSSLHYTVCERCRDSKIKKVTPRSAKSRKNNRLAYDSVHQQGTWRRRPKLNNHHRVVCEKRQTSQMLTVFKNPKSCLESVEIVPSLEDCLRCPSYLAQELPRPCIQSIVLKQPFVHCDTSFRLDRLDSQDRQMHRTTTTTDVTIGS
jgi:hypothetical protein